MADFNQVLTPGDYRNGIVNTVVEIPEGSCLKVEWHRQTATFTLDRVEPNIFAKPCNYGFIPQTLDEDGDELDTLIVCDEPLTTGIWLEAKVLGVMRFEDDGEVDDKIVVCDEPLTTGIWLKAKVLGVMRFEDDGEVDDKIVVCPADDRNTGDKLNTLDDLGDRWKQKVEHHFTHYKDLKKPGSTKVLGWGDAEEAKQIIAKSIERWNNK